MLEIDGQNGGGQLLRSSLSLALVTRQPFKMTAIRGRRSKPGLMRQHLTAVHAAAAISGGSVDGAVLGSTELVFAPGTVCGGDYRFAIGTAGSVCLLLQTLLPALLIADEPSVLKLEGGTHNPMAPTFDFLDGCFLPVIREMGCGVELELERFGFFPAGGGLIHARIAPCDKLLPVSLMERGVAQSRTVRVVSAHVVETVGKRMAAQAQRLLESSGWAPAGVTVDSVDSAGAGNVLSVSLESEHISEMACAFGERGKSGRRVASEAAKSMHDYLGTRAVVGRRLADQLLLPMALSGAGEFLTMAPSNHTQSNAGIISKFLEASFEMADLGDGLWRIAVA